MPMIANRRTFVLLRATTLATCFIMGTAWGAGNESGDFPPRHPRRVGPTHQLFVDDELIASYDGLGRVVNQPVKHHLNPVLTWDRPWEGNCVITWGSVLHDDQEKLFKMWYLVYRKFGRPRTLVCYATSRDGVRWAKPELGQVEFCGSKANNILDLSLDGNLIDTPTVLREPNPTPKIKYRAYWWSGAALGLRGATSPDGVRWTPMDDTLIDMAKIDRTSAGYDPLRKRFHVLTRDPKWTRGVRTCVLWESEDGVRFKQLGEILAADEKDPSKTELYGMIVFRYAGLQLGFLEMFYVPRRKLNTQLAYSRNGLDWHRGCDRQIFLQWGPPGSWEQAWVTPSDNPPIRVGDQLYVFYQGRQTLHWAEKPFGHIGSIGLAFLRVDGFVSLEFVEPQERVTHGYRGSATTMPLRLRGKELHLNAMARPGSVRVEVLDADGRPLPGFTHDDCLPMQMIDSVDHAIRWRNDRSLAELAGKPVRLRFHVQAAKLYSFWME